MEERERRVAQNQTIFRAGNEALTRNADESVDRLPFMCECADETCLAAIELTREEYERVRDHPRHFVLVPGHEDRGEEPAHVVERNARYVVLEKDEDAGQIAERQDPRARGEA